MSKEELIEFGTSMGMTEEMALHNLGALGSCIEKSKKESLQETEEFLKKTRNIEKIEEVENNTLADFQAVVNEVETNEKINEVEKVEVKNMRDIEGSEDYRSLMNLDEEKRKIEVNKLINFIMGDTSILLTSLIKFIDEVRENKDFFKKYKKSLIMLADEDELIEAFTASEEMFVLDPYYFSWVLDIVSEQMEGK